MASLQPILSICRTFNSRRPIASNLINFVFMYNRIADEMIDCGIVENLSIPVCQNKEGETCDVGAAFGCKVTHCIL